MPRCALLAAACLLGFAAALAAETTPARAASTVQSPPRTRSPRAAAPREPRMTEPADPGPPRRSRWKRGLREGTTIVGKAILVFWHNSHPVARGL